MKHFKIGFNSQKDELPKSGCYVDVCYSYDGAGCPVVDTCDEDYKGCLSPYDVCGIDYGGPICQYYVVDICVSSDNE